MQRKLRVPVIPAFARSVLGDSPSLPPSVASEVAPSAPGAMEIGVRSGLVFSLATLGVVAEQPKIIYATQKRWRGVDVYLQTTNGATNGTIAVQIWANIRGMRTLVASARTFATTPPGPVARRFGPGKRVCSVRVFAENFEVVLAHDGAWNANDTYQLLVVGTDEAVQDTNEIVGARSMQIGETLFGAAPQGLLADNFPIELCSVEAANNSGALRWLMLFDQTTTPVNGDSPRHTFALPIGQSVFEAGPGLRTARYTRGLFLAPSTTGSVLTIAAANGVFANMWFR